MKVYAEIDGSRRLSLSFCDLELNECFHLGCLTGTLLKCRVPVSVSGEARSGINLRFDLEDIEPIKAAPPLLTFGKDVHAGNGR